jgi:hypothetical protein
MTNRVTRALAAATLVLAAWGCKREALTEQPITAANNPAAQKVQQWLKAQPQPLAKQGRRAGKTLPEINLQWPTATFDERMGTYRVAATMAHTKKANTFAKTYLVATQNKAGQIIGGQYMMVLPDSKKMGNATAEGYNPAPLLANEMPTGFSGAVLHYNMGGGFVGSQVYSKGQLLPNATANLAARDEGEGDPSPNTVVNNYDGPTVCIDWFWQTFVNGVLFSEVYMETTCYNGISSNGGTGTGGGISPEQACANDLAAFASQGQAEEGAVSTTYTSVGPNGWEAKYAWRIYRDAPNQYEIVSYETGLMKGSADTGFVFQSLRHDYIRHNGYIRTGGTRTYQDLGAATNVNRMTANIDLNFSVTSSVSCDPNKKETKAYLKSKTFYVIGAVVYNNVE